MSRRVRILWLSCIIALPTPTHAGGLVRPDPLTVHEQMTHAEPRCKQATGSEIIVCARRSADRYRVPLIEYEAGDPRAETPDMERERLQAKRNICQQRSVFLVECGMTGVTITFAPGRGGPKYRPLAP